MKHLVQSLEMQQIIHPIHSKQLKNSNKECKKELRLIPLGSYHCLFSGFAKFRTLQVIVLRQEPDEKKLQRQLGQTYINRKGNQGIHTCLDMQFGSCRMLPSQPLCSDHSPYCRPNEGLNDQHLASLSVPIYRNT